jgi:hypothetical protein
MMGDEGAPNLLETAAMKFAALRLSHMRNIPHPATRLACIPAGEPIMATWLPHLQGSGVETFNPIIDEGADADRGDVRVGASSCCVMT